MKKFGVYLLRILVAIDQLINVIVGPMLNRIMKVDGFGWPDETLSSVIGKYRKSCGLCRWACRLLDMVDPDHCASSIEYDEGAVAQEEKGSKTF